MKLLRSTISLIYKNTRNELNLLQQNRLFCTTKSGSSEIKTNENSTADKGLSPTPESNEVAHNQRNPVKREDTNLSNVEKGILISSYSTVSTQSRKRIILFV